MENRYYDIYKTFWVNELVEGKCIRLQKERVEETVQFMKAEQIYALMINEVTGFTSKDISCLQHFDFIKYINIVNYLVEESSPIHHLKNLETLILQTYCKTELDFSKFPKLKHGAFYWRPKATSLYNCKTLESLAIQNYSPATKDLSLLAGLSNLQELTLTTSSISSLKGIEKLRKLKKLEINYFSKLSSLDGIQHLPNLIDLKLNSCKHITNLELLAETPQLKRLHIDKIGNIQNIKPLSALQNLEWLGIFEFKIEDGDMTPLFELHQLKELLFINRKHYSHTKEQILEMIKENELVNY